MLQSIRSKSKGILAIGLFGLLILSFAAWGIGDIFRGDVNPTVARVGDRDITLDEFNVALNREIRRLQANLGGRFDIAQARQFGVFDQVVERLVGLTLLSLAANSAGVRVSDEVVRAAIRGNPAFRNDANQFDRRLFDQALFNNGLSEGAYVARLRTDMARSQIAGTVLAGAAVPDDLVRRIATYRQERRRAEVVTIDSAAIKDVGQPDATTLDAFHRANAAQFMAPEYRSLTYISLRAADVAETVNIPEDKLREEYQSRIDEFTQPERRTVKQILAPDAEAAGRIVALLRQGRDFAAAAEEVTGMPPIDLGTVTKAALSSQNEALAEAVFSAAKGAPTAAVETPFGQHILLVTEVQPAGTASFAEVRARLAKSLAAERSLDVLFQLANDLDDALGGGASLEEAAATLGLKAQTVPAIDAQGRDAEGQPVAGLPGTKDFLNVAFDTEEGMDSLLTEEGTDAYFILHVDKVTPSALRPLDSIRDQVVAAWQTEQRETAAQRAAEDILKRLQAGADPETLARERGFAYALTPAVTRTGEGSDGAVPGALASLLFGIRPGEDVMSAVPGGYAVARLKEIVPARIDDRDSATAALHDQLVGSLTSDLLAQFETGLRQRYGVEVDRSVFDRLM